MKRLRKRVVYCNLTPHRKILQRFNQKELGIEEARRVLARINIILEDYYQAGNIIEVMHKFDRYAHIQHLDAVFFDIIPYIITGFTDIYIFFFFVTFFYCDEIYTIFIRSSHSHMRTCAITHKDVSHTQMYIALLYIYIIYIDKILELTLFLRYVYTIQIIDYQSIYLSISPNTTSNVPMMATTSARKCLGPMYCRLAK